MSSEAGPPNDDGSAEKDEDSALSGDAAELSAYDKFFYRHLQFVRNHATYGAQLYREPITSSSFHNPNTFWSVGEKERFFKALERFGKRRVDLICQFVNNADEDDNSEQEEEEEGQVKIRKKKTMVDIVAYMEVLEAGVKTLSNMKEVGEISTATPEVESSSEDTDFTERDGYRRENRASAREVSDKWIRLEERLAARLCVKERVWESERREEQRQKHARKFMRAALKEGGTTSKAGKVVSSKQLMGQRESQSEETESSDQATPRKDSQKSQNRGRGVRAEERTLRQQKREEMMQELREIWDREDQMECLGHYELRELDSIIREDAEKAAPTADSGSKQHRRKDSSESVPSEKETQSPAPEVATDLDDEEALKAKMSTMTPVERRRLKKRLHMRRKRAEAKGEVANEDVERLKPGRKTTRPQPVLRAVPVVETKKQKSPEKSPGSGTEQSQEEDVNADEAEGQKYKARGLTFAQKAKQRMSTLGIDVPFVQEHSLDLFNLSKFGSLWELFSDEQTIDSISYETVMLLRSYLEEFLHELILRTIVLAETERNMKTRTKVWKGALDEVS
ncbi:hypothetical protein CPB86DRAFT_872748, partial [Serendipita vermifera]